MLILSMYFIFNVNYVNQVNDKCVVARIIKIYHGMNVFMYYYIYLILSCFDIPPFYRIFITNIVLNLYIYNNRYIIYIYRLIKKDAICVQILIKKAKMSLNRVTLS